MRRFGFISLFALCIIASAGAQSSPTNEPVLQSLDDHTFQLGDVTLDKSDHSIRFPAELILNSGLVEYFLVATNGKTYESLLATSARPYHIHLAMLLIGSKSAPVTPALRDAPSVPFHINRKPGDTNPPPPAVAGDPVSIEISFANAGRSQTLSASDCLRDLSTRTNAAPGPWTYNGSRVVRGNFLAQRDGQIVAVIDDIDALVNNPRPGHDNDQIWEINSNALPPLHTPVQVTFKLLQHP